MWLVVSRLSKAARLGNKVNSAVVVSCVCGSLSVWKFECIHYNGEL